MRGEAIEKSQSGKILLIVVALAITFSSFTLWLIESWMKYPLFLFEVLTIFVLYLIVSEYDFKLTLKQTFTKSPNLGLTLDLFLIASALILLFLDIFLIEGGLVQVTLALLCTSFFSGYAILNIFQITQHFSKLENLVLSFILSYAFTGFITFVLLSINQHTRTSVTLISFIVIGLISAFKHKRNEFFSTAGSFSKKIDFIALLVAVAFFAISFCFMYPSFALLAGTDISRHYGWSIVLGRTPDLYIGSAYLLSHLHESLFISLSNATLVPVQTALVTLNLMLPIAFYVMAKPYLEKIDARLPSLATIFWALFTNSFGGFAWIYFTNLKFSMADQTQFQLLATTADKTYNGTIYGILGLWYVPGIISLTVLMAAIFLMRKKEIPTSRYIALFSICIAVLYLMHVTAAVVFALFLAMYGAISQNRNFRTDEALKSSIIGFLLVIITYYFLSVITPRFILDTSLSLSIIVPLFALLFSLLIRKFIRRKLPSLGIKSRITNKTFLKALALVLLFFCLVALVTWAMLTDSLHTWQVDTIGLVPWFMYPLILGINGLLAMMALYCLTQSSKSYTVLTLFIAFIIFAFIAGRVVSVVNLYFFNAGYWEKRFIWFIKIPLAALAPIPILFLIDRFKKVRIHVNIKTVAAVSLIGTVVIYGASTTFLNLEYWNIVSTNQPSSAEMEAVTAFKEILDTDSKAWLLTVTDASAQMATFAAPADQLVLKQLIYTACTPEMVFTQLYRSPDYSHPYIYLHERDIAYLENYDDTFFIHYLSTLPLVFNNSEVQIYNASKLSFPQANSENVLVIPLDKAISEQNLYAAYRILSQGFYNYTVAYDLDHKILDAETIILPLDPPLGNTVYSLFEDDFNQSLDSWSIIKGNWQIDNGALSGGTSGKLAEGVILSPLFAANFTSSFKFEPMHGETTEANYARLVYSWVDSKNYRVADVLFHQDGYIYIHFRDVADGVEAVFPNWPGLKTDLRWDFTKEYNITVSVNGTLNVILVNDEPIYTLNLENKAGRIGLGYNRFYESAFDDFSVTYATSFNLRPIQDYLDYLQSGGRIILLNTNGYGFFADDLFSISDINVCAQGIDGQNLKLTLPYEISVPILAPNHDDATTLSRYDTVFAETPFISHKNYGSGELLYCNIYPILQALYLNNHTSAIDEVFGELFVDLDLTELDPQINLMPTLSGYVKTIHLSSDVEVQTLSLLFPLKLELKQIDVELKDGLRTFQDLTGIIINNCSGVLIESDRVTLENGDGLYAGVKINSAFSAKPSTGSLSLTLFSDNETFVLSGVTKVSIIPNGEVHLLAYTPTLKASQASFVEFYTYDSLYWKTQTYDQNLNVTGLTQFSVILSDSYTAITNAELEGSFQQDPPLIMFDELSTFPTLIFLTLLLAPFFVGVMYFVVHYPSQDRKVKSVKGD